MKKGGKDYFFAIMILTKNKSDRYYDYISLPEWICAFQHIGYFKFLIICQDIPKSGERYKQLDPFKLLHHVSIPPFKTSFSLTMNDMQSIEVEDGKEAQDSLLHINEIQKIAERNNKKVSISSHKDIVKLIETYCSFDNDRNV